VEREERVVRYGDDPRSRHIRSQGDPTRWLAPPTRKLSYDETISGAGKGDNPVGDKGGKKDKNKSQKQMAEKRDQKAKEKRDKQQPSMS